MSKPQTVPLFTPSTMRAKRRLVGELKKAETALDETYGALLRAIQNFDLAAKDYNAVIQLTRDFAGSRVSEMSHIDEIQSEELEIRDSFIRLAEEILTVPASQIPTISRGGPGPVASEMLDAISCELEID